MPRKLLADEPLGLGRPGIVARLALKPFMVGGGQQGLLDQGLMIA
jgi:hypothetical protein